MFKRLKLRGFLFAVLLCGLANLGPAHAQQGLSPAAEEGVETAVELAIDALTEAASRGRASGGASVMLSFLVDSDELICNAWIMGFSIRLRNMHINNADPVLIQQLSQLRARVELACQPVTELAQPTGTVGGGTVGGGTEGGTGEGTETATGTDTGGNPFVARPGWTIADEICYRRCSRERAAYDRARWRYQDAERAAQAEAARVQALENDIAEADAEIARLQAELESLETAITRTDGQIARAEALGISDSNYASRLRDRRRAQGWRRDTARRKLSGARRTKADLQGQLASANTTAASLRSASGRAQGEMDAARTALEDCIRRCREQAAMAAGASSRQQTAGHGGTPKCTISNKSKEIAIGSRAEVGAGIEKTLKDTARGLFGGFGGGGASFGIGGGSGGFSPFGGGGGDEEPDLADDPIETKQTFKDPATGTEIMIGGKLTDKGLVISTEIAEAPSKGTFHAVTLLSEDCKIMRPAGYLIYKLWEEWKLTVSWTRDHYVDGQNVSHEEGGWEKSGRRDIASGVLSAAAIGTPIWKRMGFDRATEGIKGLGTPFKATGKMLASSKTKAVIHITRPGLDPVKTVPFDLGIQAKPDGTLIFSRY